MTKLTAANVATAAAAEATLNEVVLSDEFDAAIAQITDLSAPSETAAADLAELASDSISVMADGSVLAWGAEQRTNGRSYRNVVVYGGPEDGRIIFSAQTQADVWEDSQVSAD